ncbi:hypothetical protein HYPSUDRAFT_141445 [Hypholoma sublateritium FD-334 SS-4]|uniref:Endoplasmic reticulum junction formation protein lunapark n=1 Tax=Hypholoma sublateritium (strain FD-334 SS-4) TaxID=945553 RepID=A0A0D2PM88_HYPSF|nr:hypothetical protein HYPSUDRAFT_141445 [Hypholoma sublateritium FD-334 SS-4]
MSFIRRIFSKKGEEDYETILSNLADDIQKRQLKLSEIRLRERRSTLLVTLYTLAAWVAYVSLWYLNILPDLNRGQLGTRPSIGKAIKAAPVIIGPIIILFTRRVVQIWYMRKGDAEERTIKDLMKKRRDKVEEIKKKTNYYSTRDLIQRYDESSPAGTPLRQRFPPGQAPQTPQGRPIPNGSNPMTPGPRSGLQAHFPRTPITPSQPAPPQRKQWYDKLADALLGEDDPNIASPSSRYALICEKCFMHNGLVKESIWEETQYVCPKCGHFNVSVRAKKEKVMHTSPLASSPSSSPSQLTATSTSGRSQPPSPVSRQTSKASDVDPPNVDGSESAAMEVDENPDSL